jgi:hypothetical protein
MRIEVRFGAVKAEMIASRLGAGNRRRSLSPVPRAAGDGRMAAMFDWGSWEPFEAKIEGPLRNLERERAVDHFERLMAARPARFAALTALAARHGVVLGDHVDDDSPQRLGGWLAGALAAAGRDALTGDQAWRWTGLVADAALWLGERIVAMAHARGGAEVRWALCTSHKKATGYQRPVLVGFRRVADAHYYVDVAHMVASWAGLASRGRPIKADFLATIATTTAADA